MDLTEIISKEIIQSAFVNPQSEFEKTPPARLERATHSLEGCCSIRLSYGSANSGNCNTRARFFVNLPQPIDILPLSKHLRA